MNSSPDRVPFADLGALHNDLREQFDSVWQDVLERSAFVGGAYVSAFEADWASYCGAAEAVGVANGTDALALSLMALGIEPGDEVLVPSNTFIATAGAVAMVGAVPVFVDVDPVSLLVTPETLAPALTSRTTAILPVHLYGHMADMPAIMRFARAHGLAVIEDAAQAHGAMRNNVKAGASGAAGAFSFYPGKNLGALGDGGAIVTNDLVLMERLRSLSNHGRDTADRYVHPLRGVNSRLDALQAGLLSLKLAELDEWTAMRRAVVDEYRRGLGDLWSHVVDEPPGSFSVWHLLVMRVQNRSAFQEYLDAHGIDTGIHYPVPCHQQGAFKHLPERSLPVCEQAAGEVVSLPLFPHMTSEQVGRVVDAVRMALETRGE